MKHTLKTNLLFFILAAGITFFIYSCGSDDVVTTTKVEAGTISGTITFVDTTRVYTGGYYDLSVYTNWPPTGAPNGDDTIHISKNGNVYTGTYKVKGLASSGTYFLAAAFIKLPYGPGSVYVMGMNGCDTVESCYASPTSVTLPSDAGLENINFKAFIDTSKTHVKF